MRPEQCNYRESPARAKAWSLAPAILATPATPPSRTGSFYLQNLRRAQYLRQQCDEGQPLQCSQCLKRNIRCQWPDVESTRITKAKYAEMRERSQIYEELFRVMQTKNDGVAAGLLQRVRNGADIASLVRYVQDGDLLAQVALVPETWTRFSFPYGTEMPSFLLQRYNPYLDTLIFQGLITPPEPQQRRPENRTGLSGLGIQYHVPYLTADLVDPQIDEARPSQWTQVALTDDMLRTLLKSYFLYVYPTLPFFHKDYFLKDMVAGGNRFCSSLLVNAVLAAACHASNRVSSRTEYWNPDTLQYKFSAEVRRLRELEADTDSLTNIQAMLVMSVTYNMNAADRVGWSHLLQAVAMAERMCLFEMPPLSGWDMRIARTFTSWAVFCYQASYCFHFFRPPLLAVPPTNYLPDPRVQRDWYPKTRIRYPLTKKPILVPHADFIKAIAEFRIIVNDLGDSVFPHPKTQNKLSLQETLSFYSRFKQWYQSLPPSLSIKQAILPFQLFVHPFADTDKPSMGPHGALGQLGEETPEEIVLESRIGLETVWRLYYLRHGFEFYDPCLLQTQILLGFMSSRALSRSLELTPEHAELFRSTVVLAGKGLHDHAKQSFLGDTTFCLLRDTLDPEHVRLLKDYVGISEAPDVEKKRLIAKQVHSEYPISTVSIAEDPDSYRVGNIVAAYNNISLEDGLAGETGDEAEDEEEGGAEDEAEDSRHDGPSEESSMPRPLLWPNCNEDEYV
ncbi:hypothetical protein TrVFT333_001735 [Trichoderma virens FT-333]|nr:hypothetical protein TrVFT333_001735 [Trichoderma virens FT-333]